MASSPFALLTPLFLVCLALGAVIGSVYMLRRALRWSAEYAEGQRTGGRYWPAATIVLVGLPVVAAVLAGYAAMLIGVLLAPKDPYAHGAGPLIVFFGMLSGGVAALTCGAILFWLLVIRPLRTRYRES